METWELIAREQIRDTIARYNHYGDRGKFDAMIEQFTSDGVLDLVDFGTTHVGREALRCFFAGVASDFASRPATPTDHAEAPSGHMRHCVTNTTITIVDATSARADSYFQVITHLGLDHWGRYRDELVPNDGRWLLARRSVRTDGYASRSSFARP